MVRMNDLIRDHGNEPAPPDQSEQSEPVAFRTLGTKQSEDSTIDWYLLAQAELSRIAGLVREERSFPMDEVTRIATGIVDSVQAGDQLLAKAISGYKGSPILMNMINVTILATKVGMGLGYRREELIRLGQAGLLHDIGMFMLPETLVAKPDKLSPTDRALIRQHPELGFQILSRLGSQYGWLAQVALQEHERWNGQGYPKGLKENQIHEYARIIGVVDIFDALMNARPYRRKFLPHEAVRELLITEKTAFPPQIFKALVQQFSVFPLGTTVRLNTDEIGVVIQLTPGFPLRPVIRISPASGRAESLEPKVVDLSKTPLVRIIEVVGPEEAGSEEHG